jgi:hypothetical protein
MIAIRAGGGEGTRSFMHGRCGACAEESALCTRGTIAGADSIDESEDALYIDLNYFLPDAPSVDIIITTRSARARETTELEAVVFRTDLLMKP